MRIIIRCQLKGGISIKELELKGRTWSSHSYYKTYIRVAEDVQVDMKFDEKGKSFGVSHGVKNGIRIVSSEDFFKAQEEIRGIVNLLDYKR